MPDMTDAFREDLERIGTEVNTAAESYRQQIREMSQRITEAQNRQLGAARAGIERMEIFTADRTEPVATYEYPRGGELPRGWMDLGYITDDIDNPSFTIQPGDLIEPLEINVSSNEPTTVTTPTGRSINLADLHQWAGQLIGTQSDYVLCGGTPMLPGGRDWEDGDTLTWLKDDGRGHYIAIRSGRRWLDPDDTETPYWGRLVPRLLDGREHREGFSVFPHEWLTATNEPLLPGGRDFEPGDRVSWIASRSGQNKSAVLTADGWRAEYAANRFRGRGVGHVVSADLIQLLVTGTARHNNDAAVFPHEWAAEQVASVSPTS